MDDKYIVQFVTLLGAAVTSIFLAVRVYNNQTDIVRALVILLCVIVVFFIIGKIVCKMIMKIRQDIAQRELELTETDENDEDEEDSEDNEEGTEENSDDLPQ